MTKDEFLDAWEGPCLEAAQDALENADEDDVTLDVAYEAMASKLLEGIELAEETIVELFDGHAEGAIVEDLWRLTLPKEPSE